MSQTEVVVTTHVRNHGTLIEFEGLDPENYPVRFYADHRMGWNIVNALAEADEDIVALVEDYMLYPISPSEEIGGAT